MSDNRVFLKMAETDQYRLMEQKYRASGAEKVLIPEQEW
jgi:hypothetical protein